TTKIGALTRRGSARTRSISARTSRSRPRSTSSGPCATQTRASPFPSARFVMHAHRTQSSTLLHGAPPRRRVPEPALDARPVVGPASMRLRQRDLVLQLLVVGEQHEARLP